ncbi:MAG: ribosome maturation factor RimM [Candidatus Cyclobacteriaceae bacterium M3_2C_046]
MQIDSCYQLGYIIKKHGLKGEINIFLDVDDPETYSDLESVLIDVSHNQVLVPFFIEYIQLSDKTAVVKLEEVEDVEQADALKGCKLYLPLENLPPLAEGQFYFHDILGYAVIDQIKGKLGTIDSFYDLSSQSLFSMNYLGKEILIPVNDQIILQADHLKKELLVDLPHGLLELYLEE